MKEKTKKAINELIKKSHFKCIECDKVFNFQLNLFNCSKFENKYSNLFNDYDLEKIKHFPNEKKHGLGRYLSLLPPRKIDITLGEGNTPLKKSVSYSKRIGIKNLYIKDESKNPTGTFKDRKSVINANIAKDLDIDVMFSVTSGNAGISLSSYGRSIGVKTIHFLVNPKRDLLFEERFIKLAGGETKRHDKKISEIFKLTSDTNKWNCTPGFDPIGMEGYKVISWEIWEQLGRKQPTKVVVPVGSGEGVFGIYKGFKELKLLGLIDKLPELWFVQPKDSPILSRAIATGNDRFELENVDFSHSLADHLVLNFMPSLPLVLKAYHDTNGKAIDINNSELAVALKNIIETESISIIPEPSSAVVFAAIEKHIDLFSDNDIVVALLTGNGIKYISEISHIIECEKKRPKNILSNWTLKNGQTMKIEEADLGDCGDVLDIQHEMTDEKVYSLFLHKISMEEETDFFNRLKENEQIFIGRLDNMVVGYSVVVNYKRNIGSSSHIAEIGTFVKKGFREIGVGSGLLHMAIDFASRMNYEKMVLEVRASNTRAINLYKKNKFEVVACLKNHYKNCEHKEDLLIMETPL